VTTTVFILDDHELVRRGLREVLTDAGDIEIVGESGLAREAARRIPALRPDVALLDARLPDGSGIDVCREVRSRDPRIHALILTSYDDDEALMASVLAGASGYILKQIHGPDLADAVRRVAAGESLIDRSAAVKLPTQVAPGTSSLYGAPPNGAGQHGSPHGASLHGQSSLHGRAAAAGKNSGGLITELTPQEERVLDLIVEGLTNRQIGTRLNIAEKTVKNHVTSLMAKLHVERRTQAAVYGARVRGFGRRWS
jgi:DNA-binding NarL/FixJ family response regulator